MLRIAEVEGHWVRWKRGTRSSRQRVRRQQIVAAGALVVLSLAQPHAAGMRLGTRPVFENTRVGHRSSLQRVTIRSSGWGSLRLTEIALSGDHSSDFEMDARDCAGRELPTGKSCFLIVQFVPQSPGGRTALLTVNAEGIESGMALVLSGFANELGDFRIEPNPVNFDAQLLGGTATLPITLHSLTGAQLTLKNPAPGSIPDEFQYELGDCANGIPPRGHCKMNLLFTPKTIGATTATLSLEDSTGDAAHEILMRGTGIVRDLSVPDKLAFPTTQLHLASFLGPVTVQGEGGAETTIRKLELSGDAATEFTIEKNDCQGRTLKTGEPCEVSIAFRPQREGPRAAVLSFDDDSFDGSHKIELSGTGIKPKTPGIWIDPNPLAFGPVELPTKGRTQLIRVLSRGEVSLQLDGIGLASRSREFGLKTDCPRVLEPGKDCQIQVMFLPRAIQDYSTTIRIQHNAPDAAQTISVTGTGFMRNPPPDESKPPAPPGNLRIVTPDSTPPGDQIALPPQAPTGLRPGTADAQKPQVVSCSDMVLQWRPSQGAVQYRIVVMLENSHANARFVQFSSLSQLGPPFQFSLEAGRQYAWTVFATNGNKQDSPAADSVHIKCYAPPVLQRGLDVYRPPTKIGP